jgi:hypothetical protein
MKKVIKLTETDLRKIIKESVNRVLKESLGNISQLYGQYEVYFEGDFTEAIIDTSEPYIAIGDYTLYDDDAMNAINKIYDFLEYSGGDVKDAIEQYIYDELR